jgi:ferredoxin--NADP+ reductase
MSDATLNAVVTLRNQISPWLMILQVVPDRGSLPDYIPGQCMALGLCGAASRCALSEPETTPAAPEKLIRRVYSIASSPANREFLEFYIALVPGGLLSPRLFDLKIGDRIWLGPKAVGKFTYDDAKVPAGSNLVLVATSSGLAPFVSMLSTHLKLTPQRRIAVIHGVRHSWDLGYRSILMAMAHLRPNLTYLPVVSRPAEEPVPWKSATGHVQDVWQSGAIEKAWGCRPAPANTHLFMCGSPRMSESMLERLKREGFQEDAEDNPGQIHVEKYWQ